jgi:hypothetical protein
MVNIRNEHLPFLANSSIAIGILLFPFLSFVLLKSIGAYDDVSYGLSLEAAGGGKIPAYLRYIAHEWLAVFSTAMGFAAIGFVMSFLSREAATPAQLAELKPASLFLTTLIGSVFGLILLLMFVANLIQGSLFPNFTQSARWQDLFINVQDWAKLMVWSFIAGFSERFVPSLIKNLIASAQQHESK